MGRPRQTKVDAIRFVAYRDNESKQFESRREANIYASAARRSSRVEPVYYKARFWTLKVERVPLPGEELRDVKRVLLPGEELDDEDDYGGIRLTEQENTIKGPDPEVLRARAEGVRRASFQKHWPLLRRQDNLRQLSPESRLLAIECEEQHFDEFEDKAARRGVERARVQAEETRQAALDAIPTVAALFDAEVERKLGNGSILANTAEIYRYEASAFDIETTTLAGRKTLSSAKVHEISRASIQEWFGVYAARTTRLGKLPTAKTCENALSHLRTVGKTLRRRDDLAEYAAPFAVVEPIIEDLKKTKGKGDGWRNRHRLTNESVTKLIAACQSDLERSVIALALVGSRPPSEPTALEWSHLELDAAGDLWWYVQASAIEQLGGKLDLRAHTKTKEVDFRQLSIPKRFAAWIDALRGRSATFVLGDESGPMRPKDYTDMVEALIARAEISGSGISTYSLRHTAGDEVERILGRTIRDLVLHGRRDRTTGSLHYSHAQRDRRRAELTINDSPYGEHMVWAQSPRL